MNQHIESHRLLWLAGGKRLASLDIHSYEPFDLEVMVIIPGRVQENPLQKLSDMKA